MHEGRARAEEEPFVEAVPGAGLVVPEAVLTQGKGGHNLAEGATAQLVLGEDAELVASVWLQVLHEEVFSPRRRCQRHPLVMGPVWALHPEETWDR